MNKIANKYYDAETGKMYDKPGQILDILLVGKYGTRRVNSLMKEFTNNQGVVERDADLELLADTVAAMFKDQWDSRYAALTAEYEILEPYHVSLDETVSEESSDEKTVTNNLTDTKTLDSAETTTFNTTDQDTKNLTTTDTKNLTDRKTGTEDVGEGGTITDSRTIESETTGSTVHEHDLDQKTTTFNNVQETETKTGSKNNSKSGSVTELDGTDDTKLNTKTVSELNNNDLGVDPQHYGVEHTVEGDTTINTSHENSSGSNVNSVTPYAPVAMRERDQSNDASVSAANSETDRDLTLERTTNYDKKDTTETNAYHTEKTTTYNNMTDTESFTNYQDQKLKTGSIVEQNEKSGSVSTTENNETSDTNTRTIDTDTGTTYDITNSHTGTDTVTETGTDTNKKTGTETVDRDDTTTTTKTGTVGEESSGTKETGTTSFEHGNKWNATNQQILMQELELRMNNFYEQMLKDVAKLLTLSIYNQEEIR